MQNGSIPLPLFEKLLFGWYKKNRRDLPWRKLETRNNENSRIRDPYVILVSELMLQQTQVSRVLPKFEHFIQRWPTIEALSKATLTEVVIEWKGLGYNRRAKHLLECAKIISLTRNGEFPQTKDELRALPGFGPYMVSALRVFAFGEQEPVLDVNVNRVHERSGLEPFAIPPNRADEWHQLLMDFGALVCTAKNPLCDHCPLSRICKSNRDAKTLGFDSYSDWLLVQPKIKKQSKKDIGKKFEETDRYFRGRVIDFLREGEQSMEVLQAHIVDTHNLQDKKRFGRIIESLKVDGLIAISANRISLA